MAIHVLVHDSPSEADLGLSAYDRLFRFASPQEIGGKPLFQDIVTTKPRPPDEPTADAVAASDAQRRAN